LTQYDLRTTGTDARPLLGFEGDETRFQPIAAANQRPRRILMTCAGDRASWSHSLELAACLGRCGLDVALATVGEPPSHGQLEETLRLPNLQVFPGRFATAWHDDGWDEVERAGEWLLHLEEHLEPDVIHLHAYPYGGLPFRAPRLLEGHDCPVCRSHALSGDVASLQWERYRKAVTGALREARMVVTPTAAGLNELAAIFGALPECRVIPAGRSPRRFLPGTKDDLILSAGCFGDEARNLPALAEVARDLAWPVAVLMDEVSDDEARASRPVRLVEGTSPDRVAAWYGRASVFALPCRYDPSGLSALEAALAGCALVLGDVPSLRETWEGAALFVTPGDPDDLRRALDLLIAEPKGLRGLAQRARTRALLLSPERRAAAFLEAYADLLAEKPEEERVPRVS
jgi:glycosyltransferase involved in cell wall biosynthesis